MGQVITLSEVIERLDSLDGDATIYVAEPWNPQALSIIEYEPDSGELPIAATQKNMKYFLEVFVAQEFLDGWLQTQGSDVAVDQRCKRLIDYAMNDA